MFDFFDVTKSNQVSNSQSSHPRFDGWSLDERDPEVIKFFLPVWELLYNHYFQVKTDGWHHIPAEGKMLVVGSHNGGIVVPDMFMFMYDWFRRFGPERLSYGLMHPTIWKFAPALARLAVNCGAVVAHPKMAIGALQRDATVLVYPGGAEDSFRPSTLRHQIYFAGRKGFIKLALREEAPIIPIISTGAHDSFIIFADFYQQLRQLHEWGMPWLLGIDPVVFPIYLGLPWGLGIGPLPHLPLPLPIHTRVCAPIVFERYGREAAGNRDYVDECYEIVRSKMQLELDSLVQESHSTEPQN